ASARFVRTSASKARRVVNLVRGLPAKEALTVLQFAPQAASVPVRKVIASAVANAENNEQLDPDSLLVAEVHVDEGPTMKRFRPRAQGRAFRIRKRTCHITVTLEAVAPAPLPSRRPRRRPGRAEEPAGASGAPAAVPSTGGDAGASAPAAKKAGKKAAAKSAATASEAGAAETGAPEKAAAKKTAAKKTAAKKAAAKTTAAKKTAA